jgi:nicotinamide-nucleotide amidase
VTACIDKTLVREASRILKVLEENSLTLVTAESCTAGLIAAAISQTDGASRTLHGSFVVYTKANKTKALGVSARYLRDKGSVTRKVAERLLAGALRHSPADVALAVTGVLGPEPDEDGNPVGLVFIGCQIKGQAPKIVRKRYRRDVAERLRRKTVLDALKFVKRTVRAA